MKCEEYDYLFRIGFIHTLIVFYSMSVYAQKVH